MHTSLNINIVVTTLVVQLPQETTKVLTQTVQLLNDFVDLFCGNLPQVSNLST